MHLDRYPYTDALYKNLPTYRGFLDLEIATKHCAKVMAEIPHYRAHYILAEPIEAEFEPQFEPSMGDPYVKTRMAAVHVSSTLYPAI